MDDFRAIEQLTHRYARYVDTEQLDMLVELWVEGGIFDPSGDQSSPRCVGKTEIRAFFEQVFESLQAGSHHISNHMVDIDGDRATGICYWIAKGLAANGQLVGGAGYYDDKYARVDDEWRFSSRTVMPFLWLGIPPTLTELQKL
jgi:ketosteroid isomerase-like protein